MRLFLHKDFGRSRPSQPQAGTGGCLVGRPPAGRPPASVAGRKQGNLLPRPRAQCVPWRDMVAVNLGHSTPGCRSWRDARRFACLSLDPATSLQLSELPMTGAPRLSSHDHAAIDGHASQVYFLSSEFGGFGRRTASGVEVMIRLPFSDPEQCLETRIQSAWHEPQA
jgi:hypothetical protein